MSKNLLGQYCSSQLSSIAKLARLQKSITQYYRNPLKQHIDDTLWFIFGCHNQTNKQKQKQQRWLMLGLKTLCLHANVCIRRMIFTMRITPFVSWPWQPRKAKKPIYCVSSGSWSQPSLTPTLGYNLPSSVLREIWPPETKEGVLRKSRGDRAASGSQLLIIFTFCFYTAINLGVIRNDVN